MSDSNRSTSMSVSPQLARLFSVVGLLLVYFFTRLHNLMAMPLFVDESIFVDLAPGLREGQIAPVLQHSRFIHVALITFMGPYPSLGGWLARVPIVIVGVLAAGVFYGLIRSMVSHRAGIFALVLWIATPYLFFYERMALADSLLSAVSIMVVYVAWQMIQRRERWLALALGFSLVVLLLAKASGTAWLPLPLVALALATEFSWRQRVEFAVLAYGAFGVLWGAFTLVLYWREADYFDLAKHFVGSDDKNLINHVWNNVIRVWEVDVGYIGLPVVLLAIVGLVYWLSRKPRPALFVLFAVGMGNNAIVAGREINSRYALNHVVWVLLLAAVGFDLIFGRYPRWRSVLAVTAVVWVALFSVPFMLTAWDNPGDLQLVGNDRNEYIEQESSGFAVTGIGERLSTMEEVLPVLGLVSNCQTLRVAAYPVDVECPTLYWNIENADAVMSQVEEWAQDGAIYVAGEDLPYLDLSRLPQPNVLLATVERPGGIRNISLYRVEQGALRP